MKDNNSLMRINKYLAEQGVATRKGADELIERGLVTINGQRAVLGDKIGPKDKVEILSHRTRVHHYFAYYKKIGIVTTNGQRDEQEIMDDLQIPRNVFPVGRLDKDSEGLIILTDDGRVTDRLLSPEREHEKEYRVNVNKPIGESFLRKMSSGVRIEKYTTKPCDIEKIGKQSFAIILTEGKNRQIRRMCEVLGYKVEDLKRVRIVNIKLKDLKPGKYREIEGKELAEFLDNLGLPKTASGLHK